MYVSAYYVYVQMCMCLFSLFGHVSSEDLDEQKIYIHIGYIHIYMCNHVICIYTFIRVAYICSYDMYIY